MNIGEDHPAAWCANSCDKIEHASHSAGVEIVRHALPENERARAIHEAACLEAHRQIVAEEIDRNPA